MGFIVFLVIVLIFAGFIFINIKINNLKYRAKQQILKNTGASSSDISAGITESFEKKHLQKFLEEHPNFTEESIKDLLKQYTIQIFNRNSINEFSQEVYEKMQKDSKLEKMQSMEFRRTNINYYGNSKLNAIVVYTDNRDEYNVYLTCSVLDNKIQLDKYQISKGAVVGF
jgi:NH3-dependent NAD+ synthetase